MACEVKKQVEEHQELTLRKELAVARMTLENVISTCNAPVDFVTHLNSINILLNTIKDLVATIKHLEH